MDPDSACSSSCKQQPQRKRSNDTVQLLPTPRCSLTKLGTKLRRAVASQLLRPCSWDQCNCVCCPACCKRISAMTIQDWTLKHVPMRRKTASICPRKMHHGRANVQCATPPWSARTRCHSQCRNSEATDVVLNPRRHREARTNPRAPTRHPPPHQAKQKARHVSPKPCTQSVQGRLPLPTREAAATCAS